MALEVWLADGEVQMLDAVISSQLPSHLLAWQETCRQRRRSLGAHPQPRSPNKGNTYTIPAADLTPGAEACIWDTTDRHPRDVTMRALTRVKTLADGTPGLEEHLKPRISTNLSAGGDQAVNAGVEARDKKVHIPTAQSIARAAAIANTAFTPAPPPQSQPDGTGEQPRGGAKRPRQGADSPPTTPRAKARRRVRVGLYGIDLRNAYRLVCPQLLDL